MSSLTLLILLSSIFVHACNARGLSNIVKGTGKQGHLFTQHVDEAKLNNYPTQLALEISALKDLQTHEIRKNKRKIPENRNGENTVKPDETILFVLKEEVSKCATSGNDIVPSPGVSQQLCKPEGLKKSQARSMLGSSPHDTDEDVDTGEKVVLEDIVVMDYAQPHRKPPIHNEKP